MNYVIPQLTDEQINSLKIRMRSVLYEPLSLENFYLARANALEVLQLNMYDALKRNVFNQSEENFAYAQMAEKLLEIIGKSEKEVLHAELGRFVSDLPDLENFDTKVWVIAYLIEKAPEVFFRY